MLLGQQRPCQASNSPAELQVAPVGSQLLGDWEPGFALPSPTPGGGEWLQARRSHTPRSSPPPWFCTAQPLCLVGQSPHPHPEDVWKHHFRELESTLDIGPQPCCIGEELRP